MQSALSRVGLALALVGLSTPTSLHADPVRIPPHSKYDHSPIQKHFWFALVGYYTFEKCGSDGSVAPADYDFEINRVLGLFMGSLGARGEDPGAPVKDTAQDARRFVESIDCGPDAKALVRDGYVIAREFEARTGWKETW